MNGNKVKLATHHLNLLLLLLRPAIEKGAAFGGGRESEYEACRFIGRWEGSEGNERQVELYERFSVVVTLRSPIEVGTTKPPFGFVETSTRPNRARSCSNRSR